MVYLVSKPLESIQRVIHFKAHLLLACLLLVLILVLVLTQSPSTPLKLSLVQRQRLLSIDERGNSTTSEDDNEIGDDDKDELGMLPSNRTSRRRFKRGVLDLASMIKCITGCRPLSYKDYGCFCGIGGDGYPVDGIDRCCLMHDLCYEHTHCHQALVYFKSYKWACTGYGRARCATHGSACGVQLCECDRKFAKCLSRYRCPSSKPQCMIRRNSIFGR